MKLKTSYHKTKLGYMGFVYYYERKLKKIIWKEYTKINRTIKCDALNDAVDLKLSIENK